MAEPSGPTTAGGAAGGAPGGAVGGAPGDGLPGAGGDAERRAKRRQRAGLTVTVLGATAPYPGRGTAGPGYLVEGFGSRILLDCGSGVLSRMLEWCDYPELDAVVLSHLHFDHCADVLVLRYALEAAARSGRLLAPIPVYCPAEPREAAALMSYKDALAAVPIQPEQPTDIGGLTAIFVPVRHAVETYGVILRPAKVPAVGSLFFYTGDTEWMDELPERVGNCEILIAEAALTSKQALLGPRVGHMTIGEAARLGGMTNAKTIILTHHPPGRRPEEVLAEAGRALARPVLVASEGLRIEWP